jgi:hypothetical protein
MRLNDSQLGFLLGFCYGCERMRIELQHEVDETIERTRIEMQHEVDKTIERLNNGTAEVDAELRVLRAAFAHLRTINDVVESERDPATRLN